MMSVADFYRASLMVATSDVFGLRATMAAAKAAAELNGIGAVVAVHATFPAIPPAPTQESRSTTPDAG